MDMQHGHGVRIWIRTGLNLLISIPHEATANMNMLMKRSLKIATNMIHFKGQF